jgi:nucleotide-binding universal stress UspA family protein
LDFSLALAASSGAKVTLLHAIEYMPDLGEARYRAVIPDVEPLCDEIERVAVEGLNKALETRRGEFVDVKMTPRVAVGRAYKEILRAAAEERADLIVIGAQGHGLLEHLLFGSNAQHVIRRATCPVLTVRPLRTSARAKDPGAGTALAKPA